MLVVSLEQAAAHILGTNIGVTLRQIILAEEDRALSISVREDAIAAITDTASPTTAAYSRRTENHRVLEYSAAP